MDTDDDQNEASGESQEQAGGESRTNRARPDTLRDLAAALAGGENPDTDDEGAEGADEGGNPDDDKAGTGEGESLKPPETLADAAKALKLDVADLYKLTIPDPHNEGESFTLGELKDAHNQRSEFTVTQLEWEESRAQQQSELLRAQQEIEELLSHVPKRLLETDALKAAKDRLDARANREWQKTLSAIPGWKNEATRKEERAAISEHLQNYGFPKEFINMVFDSRMVRYFRENWQREKRMNDALAMVRKKQGDAGKPAKPTGRSPSKPGSQQQRTNVQTPSQKRSELVGLMGPSEKG